MLWRSLVGGATKVDPVQAWLVSCLTAAAVLGGLSVVVWIGG